MGASSEDEIAPRACQAKYYIELLVYSRRPRASLIGRAPDGEFPDEVRVLPTWNDIAARIKVLRAMSDEQLCGYLPPTNSGCESE